jgi:hypothetical protein
MAYFIRQDLSFDRILQGNFPRGKPHYPESLQQLQVPQCGFLGTPRLSYNRLRLIS